MKMITLLKKCPQGISINRINGKWYAEVRGSNSVQKSVSETFPNIEMLLQLLEYKEEYACAS